MTATGIFDLRSALESLAGDRQDLMATTTVVDPYLQLAGVYRRVGAGTPVKPPTRSGPAMLFKNVKGHAMPVLVGMLANRRRVARLLGAAPEGLARCLLEALRRPLAPVPWASGPAPCQEVVYKAPLDMRALLPVLTTTRLDGGPYITMGLLRAQDPETGAWDVTIHRLCVQGPDRLSVYFVPGRHIDVFREKAERLGQPLPVSINIGLDPAVYLAACFEQPATPLGLDELAVAGGLRQRPVELVDCLSVRCTALARAEVVIEGEILPRERVREDTPSGSGWALPEFPGYMGRAQPALPVIRVTAVTHRRNAVYQALVGPGEEHGNLAGIPTEASILHLAEAALPGQVTNVYAHPVGGGKYLAILQCRKASPRDEGRQRQAALIAFAAFSELKHVILVDEDVDLFDSNEVLWALTTRYQGDQSTVFIPGVRCHPLDPSQSPLFSPSIPAEGISCKTVFDCTVPFAMQDHFRRAAFEEVDPGVFLE